MHELVLDTEENHVLVALLPSAKDLLVAQQQGWYRMPVTERSPQLLKTGKATHIAFYQPASFGEDRYTVRWYSPVTSLSIKKRIEFLPEESHHLRAAKDYYVIGCDQLQELPQPIRSKRPRRVIAFPTTLKRLFTSADINQLFNDSPLETALWKELEQASIPAERQWDVRAGDRWFKLDFAVFCLRMNINIECDGDSHHRAPEAVERDKWRSNLLAAEGWSVMRFTTNMIRHSMPASMNMVHDAINRYGGLLDPDDPNGPRYSQGPDDVQPRLFG